MKNNSGFTLTELLAAVVILGILMGIAVPTISGVLNDQKNKKYVSDAIRLATKAESVMKGDNSIIIPTEGNCVVMSLEYLDDGTFDESPYSDNGYDKERSYVVVKRKNGDTYEYEYYVRLVDKINTNTYRGIGMLPIENYVSDEKYLYAKNAKNLVENFSGSNVKDLNSEYGSEIADPDDSLKPLFKYNSAEFPVGAIYNGSWKYVE